MRTYLNLALALLLLLAACAKPPQVLTLDEKFALAEELYAARKYERAAVLYEEVYFARSSGNTAMALLRQADCHFQVNNFSEARLAYQQFIDSFATHPEVATAYFRAAECLYAEALPPQYDQTESLHAIDAFRKVIDRFPSDPRQQEAIRFIQQAQYKLLEKTFQTGYIYYKMKDYSAALMYFEEITILGNTDSLDRRALYFSALLLHRQKLSEPARQNYDRLCAKYPGSRECRKLAKYFK